MDALEHVGPSSKLSGGLRPWGTTKTVDPSGAILLNGYELSEDDWAALLVWTELSMPAIRGSDHAYWLGVPPVVHSYQDWLAMQLANGDRVTTWDEWQADLGDSRC